MGKIASAASSFCRYFLRKLPLFSAWGFIWAILVPALSGCTTWEKLQSRGACSQLEGSCPEEIRHQERYRQRALGSLQYRFFVDPEEEKRVATVQIASPKVEVTEKGEASSIKASPGESLSENSSENSPEEDAVRRSASQSQRSPSKNQ